MLRPPTAAPPNIAPVGLARTPTGRPSAGRRASQHEVLTSFDVRQATHRDLMTLSMALTEEFSGRVAAGTVIGVVARARERLLACGVRDGLVVAAESMARARLRRLGPDTTSSRSEVQ
jgi:hypothetical protein